MPLTGFLKHFELTQDFGSSNISDLSAIPVDEDFVLVISTLGGKTFNKGLYRIYSADKIMAATEMISRYFPESEDRFTVFGYDWLGRQFAVDRKRKENG